MPQTEEDLVTDEGLNRAFKGTGITNTREQRLILYLVLRRLVSDEGGHNLWGLAVRRLGMLMDYSSQLNNKGYRYLIRCKHSPNRDLYIQNKPVRPPSLWMRFINRTEGSAYVWRKYPWQRSKR